MNRKNTMAFDADGRMTSSVDPRGYGAGALTTDFDTLYTYDAAGHQTTTTDPLNHVMSSFYDQVGNRGESTNMNGQSTTYGFDSMNRPTDVIAPAAGRTTYSYSSMGFLTSRKTPLLKSTLYEYDLVGRKTKETDPLGRFWTYSYDIAGNQISIVDAKANAAANPSLGTTTMTYDRLNRVTQRTYSDGTPTVSYVYDSEGRRTSMTDGSGTTVYGFAAADRVATVTRGADVFSYAYDNNNNVVSRTSPGRPATTASFDDVNLMGSMNPEGSGLVQFSYDKAGNPLLTTFGDGSTRSATYDNASRVSSVTNTSQGVAMSKYVYTRDNNGNPTKTNYSYEVFTFPTQQEVQTFSYDAADRLLSGVYCRLSNPTCTNDQTAWTYDLNGNRLTETKIGQAARTYVYDDADQLTSSTGPVGSATVTTYYAHNANGDQTSAGADVFTYNTARQTTGSTVGGVARTFTYDGNNNRNLTATGATQTSELWDTVGGLPNLALERTSGVVQRTFTYGRGSEPIRFNDVVSGSSGSYFTDDLGKVANVSKTGFTYSRYTYDPFGASKTTVVGSYASNPLRFIGQHLDSTGNYNL